MNAYTSAPSAEPVGIVISRGDRAEPRPRTASWLYAPSPIDATELQEPKAA